MLAHVSIILFSGFELAGTTADGWQDSMLYCWQFRCTREKALSLSSPDLNDLATQNLTVCVGS